MRDEGWIILCCLILFPLEFEYVGIWLVGLNGWI
jgi:hypothetical protein